MGNETLFLCEFVNRVKDCYQQDWYREMCNSSKLSVYCTFKSLLDQEKYLSCVNIWKYRKALARFRCSCHNLEIEKGRHEGILLENRLCKFCDQRGLTVIEDEYHFLLCCPRYIEQRNRYINKQYTNNPTYQNFIEIMSTDNAIVIKNLASFIVQASLVRNDV